MEVPAGRIGSPNALDRSSDPRQTHSSINDKTVITHETEIDPEAKAKLRKINKPMNRGRALIRPRPEQQSVPRDLYSPSLVVLVLHRSSVKSIVVRSEALLSLVQPLTRVSIARGGDEVVRIVHPFPREGHEREPDTQDRGYGDRSIRQQASRAMIATHGNR